MNQKRRDTLSAFTLIELLVVVAIIAMLAGLAVTAVPRAMNSARSTKCVSNLRQIVMASMSYSGDNNGVLVPVCIGTTGSDATVFRALLAPYLAADKTMAVFRCPADKMEVQRVLASTSAAIGYQPTSYGINTSASLPKFHTYLTHIVSFPMGSVPNPPSTIFLSDIGKPDSINGSPSTWTEKSKTITNASFGYAKMPNVWTSGDFDIYPRHPGGKCNVAFYDGHCASIDIAKDLIAHPPGDPDCLYDYH